MTRISTLRRGVRRRLILPTLALVALGLLASACGGGSGAPGVASLGSTSSTTTSLPPAGGGSGKPLGAQAVKFSQCMRSHGIRNFPMPVVTATAGGQSVSLRIGPGTGINPKSPKFQSAQAACAHLLPARVGQPEITSKDQTDYLKAAACVRAHGFPNFPDPTFPAGGVNFKVPSDINANSPQFLRAVATCRKLIPAGLPYSS